MFGRKDVKVQQERFADYRREAERDRLVQEALAQSGKSGRLHNRTFHRLRDLFASHWYAPSARAPTDTSADALPVKFEDLMRAREQIKG